MIQVTGNLYRGPRPTDFGALKDQGIGVIVNLEDGWYDTLHWEARSRYDRGAALAGLTVQHHPLSDLTAPQPGSVDGTMDAIDAALPTGVYVHCLHGEDRTGYVCAAYRISRMGWTIDAAVAEMLALGFRRVPYQFWIDGLKRFATPEPK